MERFKVEIKREAIKELLLVKTRNFAAYKKFWVLALLKAGGVGLPQVSKVGKIRHVWRLRFGRYRALFTLEGKLVTVWVVFLKTDPYKEYQKWIEYLRKRVD